MQSEKGKHSNPKQPQHRNQQGRVISMRAWKAKKRIRHVRGNRHWAKYLTSVVGLLCTCVCVVLALISCIPFNGQIHAITIAWFTGTIGCGIGLLLHVWRDRWASRVLIVCTSSLAVSFVAALAKFVSLSR